MILFVLAICSPLISLAKELTLEEAINIALEKSFTIKHATEKIKAAEVVLKSAKAERMPKLILELTTGYKKIISTLQKPSIITIMKEEIPLPQPTFDPWENEIFLSLSQPIYTGGKISNTIKRLSALRDSSLYERNLKESNIYFDVISTYWELKKAILLKELYQARVEQAKNKLKIAKARFEAQEIPAIDVQQQEVSLANISSELLNAEITIEMMQEKLSLLLNIDDKIIPIEEPQIEEEFPYELSEIIKKALSNRLEIYLSKKTIEEKKTLVNITKSKKYPQVYLVANHNWSAQEDEFEKSISKIKATRWQGGLKLNLLIFDAKQTSSDVEKAISELKMAEIELEDLQSKIKSEVTQTYKKLTLLKQIVQTQIKNLALAKENFKIATSQYKLGIITNIQLNEMELVLKEANTKLIEAIIDYKIQLAKLKKVIGEYDKK